ncbi:hypothetical protein WH96_01145 [Kiloniella spongiae]|uniref:Tyr recombinase domain-containing protein n=1 Tax=Kiloniella spongiae TaxID=1489064 RepID=A0A0H2MJ05_9PROT|nr:site-specific integrase [Kiloniella spongiae]KLN62171.1 hypothetical protein WH96_01145 [Kiloniella spongiae]
MASIRQLKSGKFNAQIRLKGLKPISGTFITREEAEHWVAQQESRHTLNVNELKENHLTLFELGSAYSEQVLKGRSSYETTVRRLERFRKRLPHLLTEITKEHVNNYRLARLKEVGSVAVRDELQLLNRFYRWGYGELLIDKKTIPNPVKPVKLPRASKPSTKIVSREELRELLDGLTGDCKIIVELLFETACRRSEIVFITAGAIDLTEQTIFLEQTKTDVERYVPLTTRAVTILEKCIANKNHNDRLFNITPAAVTRACARVRKAKNLHPHVRPHQLRHSRITEVARKGFNQGQLALVSGHRDARSLTRYTHLSVKDVIKLIE